MNTDDMVREIHETVKIFDAKMDKVSELAAKNATDIKWIKGIGTMVLSAVGGAFAWMITLFQR